MIDLNNIRNCTGCGACVQVCPKQAITLQPNPEGFLYPQLNTELCMQCSLCDAVCQMGKKAPGAGGDSPKFYALVNKNAAHLKQSSSGGAFLAVAEKILASGGMVAGCAFDESLKATHIITNSLNECIEKLCGSKYVQSDTNGIYSRIKALLPEGKPILFVGTPCQVAGLYLYLRERPENLITMDLICHGVSSPLLWKKHKEYLESRVHTKINKYCFRGKEKAGWALYYYYYYGKKNKCKRGPSTLDRYYTDFLKGANYRESCYTCQFANLTRIGDITIGDFWGAEKFINGIDMHKGVSLVIPNSEKGHCILNDISDRISLTEVTQANAVEDNHNLVAPTPRPAQRNTYYQGCYDNFEVWEKSYVETSGWKLAKLKSMVPSFIKRILRR